MAKRSLIIALALLLVPVWAAPALWAQESRTQSGSTYSPLSGIQRPGSASGASDGILYSDFRVSQIFTFSSSSTIGNFISTQAVSGDFHYGAVTPNNNIQFRYDGGAVFYHNSYQSTSKLANQRTTTFHDFDVSDSFQFKKLGFLVGDTFTYTPDTFGFGGGIPGIGNIGGFLGTGGLNPGQLPQSGILLQGQPRLSNATFVQANYSLTPRSTLTSSVSYGLSRFPDFEMFNSRQLVFSEGGDYRVTAKTSVALNYDHSRYTYDHLPRNIQVDYGSVAVSHQFNKSLSVQGSIGPQYIQSPGAPARHSIGGGAAAHYVRNLTTWVLHYSRSVNSGSFAIFGAQQDLVGLTGNRQLSRAWNASVSTAYTHSTSLLGHQKFDNEQFGIDINRKFGQRSSGYLDYSYRRQSSNFSFLQFESVLSGSSNTVGIGFNFTPRGLRLKRY